MATLLQPGTSVVINGLPIEAASSKNLEVPSLKEGKTAQSDFIICSFIFSVNSRWLMYSFLYSFNIVLLIDEILSWSLEPIKINVTFLYFFLIFFATAKYSTIPLSFINLDTHKKVKL